MFIVVHNSVQIYTTVNKYMSYNVCKIASIIITCTIVQVIFTLPLNGKSTFVPNHSQTTIETLLQLPAYKRHDFRL